MLRCGLRPFQEAREGKTPPSPTPPSRPSRANSLPRVNMPNSAGFGTGRLPSAQRDATFQDSRSGWPSPSSRSPQAPACTSRPSPRASPKAPPVSRAPCANSKPTATSVAPASAPLAAASSPARSPATSPDTTGRQPAPPGTRPSGRPLRTSSRPEGSCRPHRYPGRGKRVRGRHAPPRRHADRRGGHGGRRVPLASYEHRHHRDRFPLQPGQRLGEQGAGLPAAGQRRHIPRLRRARRRERSSRGPDLPGGNPTSPPDVARRRT